MSQRTHNPEKRAWRGRSYKKGGELVVDLKAEAAEEPLITELDVGSAEPFCACGRRISQCDPSRTGCGS